MNQPGLPVACMQDVCRSPVRGWKEPDRTDELDGVCPRHGLGWMARLLTGRSCVSWGSRGREFKSPQPDKKHQVRPPCPAGAVHLWG